MVVVVAVEQRKKKERTYVNFVEEVASCRLGDNRVYIFEDQKTRRHIPRHLKNVSNIVRACRRFDIETWDRQSITPEKRIHQSLDGDRLPVSGRPYAVITISIDSSSHNIGRRITYHGKLPPSSREPQGFYRFPDCRRIYASSP